MVSYFCAGPKTAKTPERPKARELQCMQRWMQAFIVHPGAVEEALEAASSEGVPVDEVSAFILPSSRLTSLERVEIYRGMYVLRLADALAVDYPGVKYFLGKDTFRELVAGYVHAYPSRSYTLNRLGDHFPEYIKTAPGLTRRAFLHELAMLELAVTEVFDSPESPVLTGEEISKLPLEAWEGARLRPVAAFRLLSFRYPVNAYLSSVRDEQRDHPRARRKDTWVAVFRRNYSCWRLDLTRPAHDLLEHLVSGSTLGDAITADASKHRSRKGMQADQLFRWFRDWVSEGIFQTVDLSTA